MGKTQVDYENSTVTQMRKYRLADKQSYFRAPNQG